MHCRRCSFFEISCVISNWYATRSSNNTTIYMDLGESSTFFRIRCLEFYFPRHSVAFLPLSSSFSASPDLSFPLLSLSSLSTLFFFFFSFFSPRLPPPRFQAADRSAGHQRGFIPHSGTGVISHGWIGNPLSLYSPASAHLPPIARVL